MRSNRMLSWFTLLFALTISNLANAQVDLSRFFSEFKNGTAAEQNAAVRGLASLVIRQSANDSQREEIINFLKEATQTEDAALRLSVHTELLKIAAAEDDTELGRVALAAVNDKNVNVRRRILRYFRTFFSKRYEFGKEYQELLTSKLKDEDIDVRFQAASTLHSWGISDKKTIELLIDAMQLTNYRSGIVYSLATDKNNRVDIIESVLWRLRKSDHLASIYIGLLSELTPESRSAITTVLQKFTSEDPAVRVAVINAIGEMQAERNKSLSVLKSAVDDPVSNVRLNVLPALVRLDPDKETLKEVILKLLDDRSSAIRELAATSMSFFADDFGFIWPEVKKLLAAGDDKQKAAILNGLAMCGPMCESAIEDVIPLLKSSNYDLRVRSCWALGEIAIDNDNVTAALNEMLKTENASPVILSGIQAVSQFGPNDEASKDNFLKHLDDETDFVRLSCVKGLNEFRDPKLVERLMTVKPQKGSQNGSVLTQLDNAIVATVAATGEKGWAIARKFLTSDNPIYRARAYRVFAAMGSKSDDALDLVIKGMQDKHPLVSYAAAIAASKMATPSQEVLDQMFALTDRNSRSRTVNILNLFGEMGANAGPITPKIAGLMNGDYRNRFANDAKRIVIGLGKDAAPALTVLGNGNLNLQSLDCIAAIGVKDEEVAKSLKSHIELLTKKISNNRNIATQAADIKKLLFAATALLRSSEDRQTFNDLVLKELEGNHKSYAYVSIKKAGKPDQKILDALLQHLPDAEALQTIGGMESSAIDAKQHLIDLIGKSDKETDLLLKQTIWKIDRNADYAIQVIDDIVEANRFELTDIRIEQRQLMWEAIRFLKDEHTDSEAAMNAVDRIRRGRFANLRTFVFDLDEQSKGEL